MGDILKNRDLEIITIANEFKSYKEDEFKVLMDENNELKMVVKNLNAVKADLLKEIDLKDSLLEEINSDLTCDECDFVAGTVRALLVHIRSPHKTLENESTCKKCDFQADDLKSFLYHLTTEHLRGTKLFKCSDFFVEHKKSLKNLRSKKS